MTRYYDPGDPMHVVWKAVYEATMAHDWLAFGSLQFIEGQIVAKAYMTLAAITVLWLVRRRTPMFAPA